MLWGRESDGGLSDPTRSWTFQTPKCDIIRPKVMGQWAGKTGDETCMCVNVVLAMPSPINHSSVE